MPLIRKAFKRLHYPVDVLAQCVRWYLAYSLSLRDLEEMMAERRVVGDGSTLHRWVVRLVPLLDTVFRRHKRTVSRRWRMDETYIKVKGQWKYLYRAVDAAGHTIDFLLTAKRDTVAALRFFRKGTDVGLAWVTLMTLSWWVWLRKAPAHVMPERVENCEV